MGLNIKNEETVRLVRELADQLHVSMTVVITDAVTARLAQVRAPEPRVSTSTRPLLHWASSVTAWQGVPEPGLRRPALRRARPTRGESRRHVGRGDAAAPRAGRARADAPDVDGPGPAALVRELRRARSSHRRSPRPRAVGSLGRNTASPAHRGRAVQRRAGGDRPEGVPAVRAWLWAPRRSSTWATASPMPSRATSGSRSVQGRRLRPDRHRARRRADPGAGA